MAVLYRKYRPQAFDEVTGQAHITATLAAAIAAGRIAHAYLFSGPRGVGKTTTARILAKAVNCERKDTRTREHKNTKSRSATVLESSSALVPCNACGLCTEITEGRCLDVVEIDAASHTQVEHIREHVIDVVRVAPSRGARKVFIIDEVHMLSKASFNALLKTLEEPPDHVLFILATTELDRVPETVRSRCQHFGFRRVSQTVLESRLALLAASEGMEVAAEVFTAVARAADGSVRDAESLLGQLMAMGGATVTLADASLVLPHAAPERAVTLVAALAARDAATVIAELHAADANGVDAGAFLRDVVAACRAHVHAEIAERGAATLVDALRACAQLFDEFRRSEYPYLRIEATLLAHLYRNAPVVAPALAAPARIAAHSPAPAPVAKPEAPSAEVRAPASASLDPAPRVAPPPPVPAAVAGEDHDALAKIRAAWTSILLRVGETNHSLPFLLEGGRPKTVAGGVCTLGFKYKLHSAKVRSPGSIGVVTDAIIALTGVAVHIDTTVISAEEFAELDAAVRPKTGDAVADAALEVFGGSVVE